MHLMYTTHEGIQMFNGICDAYTIERYMAMCDTATRADCAVTIVTYIPKCMCLGCVWRTLGIERPNKV